MSDSCNPRKLDPGLAARYSKPSDLITSTMKSDPGRSVVRTSTPDASVSASTGGAAGATKGWAPMAPVVATRLATPLTAAPFKNARRSTAFLDLSMAFGDSPQAMLSRYAACFGRCQCPVPARQTLGHRSITSTMQYVGTSDAQAAEAAQAA